MGKIPSEISNMESLEMLNLSHNNLSGFIPTSFEDMKGLSYVDISYNDLEGPLPNSSAFRNALPEALQGNKGLCGNIGALKSCKHNSKKDRQEDMEVYTEQKLSSGNMVAVKKLHLLHNGENNFQKEFFNEIRALTEIRHRKHYEALWFLGSLATMLSNDHEAKELGWSKRVNIVKGLANALSYMHRDCLPPIVHRDISSKNVLLDSEYEACVSDFGTAKFLNPDSTNWSALAGTFGYIAPGIQRDLLSSLSSVSLLSSSSSALPAHQMPMEDILDQRISPPTHQEAGKVVSLVQIAFACLNPVLHRPTMKQVSQDLSTQRLHLSKSVHMITCGELLALDGFTTRGMNGLSYVDISYNDLEGPPPNSSGFWNALPEALQVNKGLCGNIEAQKSCKHNSKKDRKVIFVILFPLLGALILIPYFTGNMVAVKKLHLLHNGKNNFQKEFFNEIRALTEIRHRNIMKLYGFCLHHRHSFLVYEYLERDSLATTLSNDHEAKELGWSKMVNIVKDLANALSDMQHNCLPPIVHRDISSKNVLLDSEYEACVSDFGTAKFLNPESTNWTATVGRHPGDVFSSLSSGASPSSSSTSPAPEMSILDVLDQCISPPSKREAEEVVSLVKIAFASLNPSPQCRPTMEKVSQLLSSTQRLHLSKPLHMTTFGELLALDGGDDEDMLVANELVEMK
ncbi:Probable LRR receptor-like serine/threonine-protein kinase [Prunus dulcis]|uniref:non-specific serine/threonine protein kinase n=1 Tax=Prunus dulcis TaxID=3755 RepID=A0A4Y1R5L6_PRUDU|nr:Probable LRR receptor-like serine/threonine-protein kinase [Prunus dulcis]